MCNHCTQEFSPESFLITTVLYGSIFLWGEEYGYIGIVCPSCKNTTLKKADKEYLRHIYSEMEDRVSNSFDEEISNGIFDRIEINGLNKDQQINALNIIIDNISLYGLGIEAWPKHNPFPLFLLGKSSDFFKSGIYWKNMQGSSDYVSSFDEKRLRLDKETIELKPGELLVKKIPKVYREKNDEIYLENYFYSYMPHTELIEGRHQIFYFHEDKLSDLISHENKTKLKVFPRYFYVNSGIEACENYCKKILHGSQYPDDPKPDIHFPIKDKILKNYDFLNSLEGYYYDLMSWMDEKIILKNFAHYENQKSTILFDTHDLIPPKQQNLIVNHLINIDYLWSVFINESTQNILFQKSFEFVVEYFEMSKRIDCSYFMLSELKRKYAQELCDFVRYPEERQEISKTKKHVLDEVKKIEKQFPAFKEIKSQDHQIMKLKLQISKIAQDTDRQIDILLVGESGTGKELFAKAIHEAGRKEGPFVAIDCAAISPNLFESKFFGHEKGAFTGATSKMKGCFELANGGVLFLDEIGNLSLEHQMKFFRVLESREIQPVGSTETIKFDVKIVYATNVVLIEKVQKGEFRLDLLYRINTFPYQIPPLRERKDDIPLLIDHFIQKHDYDKMRDSDLETFQVSDAFLNLLKEYHWPGNVRELENKIEKIIVERDNNRGEISPLDLPSDIKQTFKLSIVKNAKILDGKSKINDDKIITALEKNKSNRRHAAKELGINERTLYRRIEKMKSEGKKIPPSIYHKK